MALSTRNRERIGQAFELLALGLEPYLDRRMRSVAPSPDTWLEDWAAAAAIRGPASLRDPALQLRIMAESWDAVFRNELTRSDRNVVFELRDVRNRWAHNDPFTVDDAYRGLDSIERLLVAVDAVQAAEVGKSKEELMRARYEAQARKATPASEVLVSQPAAGLKSWREVIQPHDDVARGRYSLAEFAADLHQVSVGEGSDEYRDPVGFYERTFLTAGLHDLLGQAVERLAGTGGAPVVDLQTSFGGGKTHSMIALYHLFSGTPLERFPQEVQDLVRSLPSGAIPAARRAVLVGTRLAPGSASIKEDGTEVGTLWGELAWQLGGREAFALIAEADRTRTNPGDGLSLLLKRYSPCLILIDEWVAYARGLMSDDSLRGGSFDTHFSFAQALTETVRTTPGALLVVSLPASGPADGAAIGSDIEVGGAGGREALRRLRAVVGRMESSWRPATAEESFEIVRRRLFQPVESARLPDRDATARVFGEFYRQQAAEFPAECREASYVERIKRAYPMHPELFARLYEDWSTLDRFQRTRGVLRLMATVVHALWSSGDQSPLILPASVPLGETPVANELTRNLDDSWKPIMDADVDGPGSLPRALDDEYKNLGRYLATRRVARTVFLGSAPRSNAANPGLDASRVRLGCALPGEAVAIYGDALNRLADRATYFYVGGGRYWFATQPSVARLARDRAQLHMTGDRHEVHDLLVDRLRPYERERGQFAGVHVAPSGPGDVADSAEARLVILGPDTPHLFKSEDSLALSHSRTILDSRGPTPRDYRNMLVFLAADQRRVGDLEQAAAEFLAWSSIVGDAGLLNLSPHQEGQAADRKREADRTVTLRLAEAYQWLLVPRLPQPTQPIAWDAIKIDGEGALAERAARKLIHGGGLYLSYPPVLLRLQLDGPLKSLWDGGDTTVNAVWEAYAKYLYLHRLRSIDVLCATVGDGPGSTTWASEGVAVAEGLDQKTGRYLGLIAGEVATGVRGTTLLVNPLLASAQLDWERGDGPPPGPDADDGPLEDPDAQARLCRFYGVVDVDPDRLGRDAGRIAQEVVAHLNGLVGTDVSVTLELRATNADGFPDDVVRIVSENTASLRFLTHGFEEH